MSRLLELDAYVTGELSDAQAEALEEGLFAAPDDPDVVFLDRVAQHGTRLASHGTFHFGVSRAHIETLREQGVSIDLVDAGAPTAKLRMLSFPTDGELLATCFDLGRTDLERVDIEIYLLDQQLTKLVRDVFVDRTDGRIYALCERPLANLAFSAGPVITRVHERDGDRAVIAEWHLDAQPG